MTRPPRATTRLLAALAAALLALPAMALDLAPLWDFADPAASEQRFRAALAGASPDDTLVLQTQIARTWGIRGDFDRARAILRDLEPRLAAANAEARVRHALEWGRTFASATHPAAGQTDATRAEARAAFTKAHDLARAARLDALAIDALHMQAFVDTAPADQLRWAREALAVAECSVQPDARRWQASLLGNAGHALHQLGRYDEALEHFERALAQREAAGNAKATHLARWMVARTLREMGRVDEALAIQQRLERDGEAARAPDPYVFEELEKLHRLKGDEAAAAAYAKRRQPLPR